MRGTLAVVLLSTGLIRIPAATNPAQTARSEPEKYKQSPSNPYFVDCGKSSDTSRAARSAVIVSPMGDLALAETRAHANEGSCSNTAMLRVKRKGGEWRTVFLQEPEEMQLGAGIRIIDWSADGRYLLFDVLHWQYGSDAETSNTIWIYNLAGFFKQVPLPPDREHQGCFVTIEPLGFTEKQRVVLSISAKQAFDVEGEAEKPTCKENVSYWSIDVVSNEIRREDKPSTVKRYGRPLRGR